MSEWVDWHTGYEGDQPLARRLRVVQRCLVEALDRCPPGAISVISMCAGDGRDLLGVLPSHPRRHDVSARLVELDPALAAAARARVADQALHGIEVVSGDAALTDAYESAVPADVLLVCGVFGNITDADVRRSIDMLPSLAAAGATVIWTRGRFEPDLTPAIRAWFADAGFSEAAFVPIPDSTASVGMHRLVGRARPFAAGVRLFTFLEAAQRPSRANKLRAH